MASTRRRSIAAANRPGPPYGSSPSLFIAAAWRLAAHLLAASGGRDKGNRRMTETLPIKRRGSGLPGAPRAIAEPPLQHPGGLQPSTARNEAVPGLVGLRCCRRFVDSRSCAVWCKERATPTGASPVSDRFPSKPITLDTYTFQLHGISTNDAYWKGLHDNFEPEFQRFCRQLIHPDYVCLDIGANIGIKTLFLSRHCRQGCVIAVEAGKAVADCLATNIAANGCPNVISHSAAAAGHDGTLIFDEDSAWGHEATNGVEVEALTLEIPCCSPSTPAPRFRQDRRGRTRVPDPEELSRTVQSVRNACVC